MENHSDVVYTLKASYLEVYNEKVQHTVEQTFQIVKKSFKGNSKKEALKVTLRTVYLSKCRVHHA